tara:strand:+ start:842 stop:1612 length:771 start_codon:yes stop_codon:yes gene_type:complete
MHNRFSYDEYKEIISLIQKYLPIVSFNDVIDNNLEKYCVIRHDVEYSMDRALKLAQLEYELKIKSTYCIQVRNNIYNAISDKNIEIAKQINDLGHEIALHQDPPAGFGDYRLKGYLLQDMKTLSMYYDLPIKIFSYHRPKPEYLQKYFTVEDKINTNGNKFFHYIGGDSGIVKPEELNVTYLADSNHKWKWGDPKEVDFSKINKLQMNMHPYSWSKEGHDNLNNSIHVVKERTQELTHSMTEIKTFPRELLKRNFS